MTEAKLHAAGSRPKLGATYFGDSTCAFLVWAPKVESVEVHVTGELLAPLTLQDSGYFYDELRGVGPGARYKFRLNHSAEFPDPASRYQPEGVHGPSEIVAEEFAWTDQHWRGIPLPAYVIYELHVGTFTPAGTFDSVIEHLDDLKELGVTALEIMPVSQFPGSRNWGYDGVYPYAAQASYGGPAGLKRLVDAAHGKEFAVVLDVVYNHMGPEGNYFEQFGYYFTDRHDTPWGKAVNFDGENCAGVRRFVLENALQWTTEFHIDALRLDAIHTIFDASEPHILFEMATAVHQRTGGRLVHLIAESNLNDVRVITPAEEGGLGLDAQWNDDFHHCLHALMTRERAGYYQDFGDIQQLAKSYAEGFAYTGQHSRYRGGSYGTESRDIPAHRFVVFSQNHDQTGNRMSGDRLSSLLSLEELKLAAGAEILSPFVPMLFMGQEYAETAPFLYFVSHSEPGLIEAVRKGRRDEFATFAWKGEAPDPQAEETFLRCKLRRELKQQPRHRKVLEFYTELLRLRRSHPALRNLSKTDLRVTCLEHSSLIALHRWHHGQEALVVLHFGDTDTRIESPLPSGVWRKEVDSSDEKWLGAGGRLPEQVSSNGKVHLNVAGKSIGLLTKIES